MKKLSKFLYWTICLGSVIIGGILLCIGISLGGATSFTVGSSGLNFYHDLSFANDATALFSKVIDDQVVSINLDLEFTEVVITSGEFLSVNYTSDIAYKTRNDTLEIISTQSKSNRFGMYRSGKSDSFVKITVPDYITDLEITTSGKTSLYNLSLDKIELDIALGDILAENTIANDFEIFANLGNITLKSCTFDNLDVELDMGNLTTSNLEILSSARIKNDMGSLDIDLSGEESDYNFKTSVDLGSFSLNGKNKPTFYGFIDILTETTMGSVKITTK